MENLTQNMYVRIECIDGINRIVKIIDIVEKNLFDYVGICPYYQQLHWFTSDRVIEIIENFDNEKDNV